MKTAPSAVTVGEIAPLSVPPRKRRAPGRIVYGVSESVLSVYVPRLSVTVTFVSGALPLFVRERTKVSVSPSRYVPFSAVFDAVSG